VIKKANSWAGNDRMMYVVGATRAEEFLNIRKYAPDHFLLVPGVGAQGGSLQEVCKYGLSASCGLLVNSSRSIIFASSGEDFAERAREEAKKLQSEMALILDGIGF
jgi:orotidine-5'-phosphate decarboxylase